MPQLNLTSDLIETVFTPEEKHRAMQLMDRDLSYAYLQNTRVSAFREMISLSFAPEDRDRSILRHAVLTGYLEILDSLLAGILNPEQPPVDNSPSPTNSAS